jgi:hypothetical protein
MLKELTAAVQQYDRTGGYYRESYSLGDWRGDLLGTLGLGWSAILDDLPSDERGCRVMSPEYARHLLAELGMRPVTPAMMEARCISRGVKPAAAEMREATKELETLRAGLMALLQKAVDLGEPLIVDG